MWFGVCVKKMRCVEEFQSTFYVGKAFTEGGVKNKTSPPHPGLKVHVGEKFFGAMKKSPKRSGCDILVVVFACELFAGFCF